MVLNGCFAGFPAFGSRSSGSPAIGFFLVCSLSSFRSPLAAAGCRLFFLPPPANEAWGTPPRGAWNHDAKVRHFFRLCKFSGHFFSSNFKLKPILPATGCLMGVLDGRMTVLGRFSVSCCSCCSCCSYFEAYNCNSRPPNLEGT